MTRTVRDTLQCAHKWRQLKVISNQNKPPGIEQGAQDRGEGDLARLVDNADIEAAAIENGVIGTHARRCNDHSPHVCIFDFLN